MRGQPDQPRGGCPSRRSHAVMPLQPVLDGLADAPAGAGGAQDLSPADMLQFQARCCSLAL